MNRSLALIAISASFCGTACHAAPLIAVADILAHCDRYKGKSVEAAGYLGECAGYDCQLFANKAAATAFDETWKERGLVGEDRVKLREVWSRLHAMWPMGVGGNDAFDRKAGPLQHGYVVITGRIADDSCIGEGTDRAYGIKPVDIRPWTPAEGAPANTQ